MEEIFKCPVCGREFNSRGSLGSHLGHHVRKGDLAKSSDSSNELPLHKVDNQGKIIEYVCKCGRSFTNKQSYCSHCSHCEVRTGKKDKGRGSNIQDWWNNLKYENPDKFYQLHAKAGRASIESNIIKYGDNPLMIFSKTPSKARDEAHRRQSETRKRRYLSGELTPAEGIGRGYGSYFNGIYLRSSYEMIYALYLFMNNLEFEYESVRIKYNDRTYISDFKVRGKLIEVKGKTKDITNIKAAFESNGYEIEFVTPSDIPGLKEKLRSRYLIDELLILLERYTKESRSNRFLWTVKDNGDLLYNVVPKSKLDKNNIIYPYKVEKEAV